MNPYALLGAGLLWVASIAAAGWWAYGAGRDAELAAQARDDRVSQQAAQIAADTAADAISRITVVHQTVKQETEREYINNPVYRNADCVTGSDSLRRFNSTIPTEPGADPRELPASDSRY